jgi:hypothetical protein
VQVFVDPRSSKFRRNFKVIKEHINNMKKIDPNISIKNTKGRNKNIQSIKSKNKSKPNIQILAEILNGTNSIPFSTKREARKRLRSTQRPVTSHDHQNQNKEVIIPNDTDFIDEYELQALQHKVISQNIKQGIKRIQSSRRFETIEEESEQKNADTFREFKNFIRPSTSAVNFEGTKLLKSPSSKNNEPKFLSAYSELSNKEIKTYKDLKIERHLMPLEINYKYKIVDFYSEKQNLPTTASQGERANKNQASKFLIKTSQGKRPKFGTKISPKSTNSPPSNFRFGRSASTGELVESIPSKRPVTRQEIFPEDF